MHQSTEAAAAPQTDLWNLMIYCIFMLVLFIGGVLIGLNFFKLNSFAIQILFYFIYGNLQIAWTILVSTVFTKAKTATVASYLYVFLSGLVANVLLQFFVQSTGASSTSRKGRHSCS